ncbi:MAG: hypothetical protein COV66_07405 [Nitrospinae bacterium CG11_big_fil_rev_8_21_14_0_20_45_15]|nr:MAG: hypothetical protein COV66_07405 [Nitrospinae bacterium CG11_big_fil_rev_8_21_14_0_20_45_15]
MKSSEKLDRSVVCVTGGTGFIGGHLVDALLERGCEVRILVRPTSSLQYLQTRGIRVFTGDLNASELPAKWLDGADYLFHCAGLTIAKTRAEFFRCNAYACESLYRSAVDLAGKTLRAVVHLSSLASVGPAETGQTVDESTACRPVTHYGQSKLAGEKIALKFASELPMVTLRPPVVYGPREKNFFEYLKQLARGWQIQIGAGQRYLSLIHSTDLVRAMIVAAENPLAGGGQTFFVTDGGNYSWDDVAGQALSVLNQTARKIIIPESAMTGLALLLEAVHVFRDSAPLLDRQRMIDIRQSVWTASSEKFFETFQFHPMYDLKDGLENTFAWHLQQRWL